MFSSSNEVVSSPYTKSAQVTFLGLLLGGMEKAWCVHLVNVHTKLSSLKKSFGELPYW